MSIRFQIACLVFLLAATVLFGVGVVAVLATPGLALHAGRLIPAVVVTSFVVAAPLSWFIAPRLTALHSRQHTV